MPTKRHTIHFILIAAALTGCSLLASADTESLTASGVAEVKEVDVAAELGGRVSQVHVEEGDPVDAGQALLTLENEDLQLQRDQVRAQGEAAVAEAELALLQAQQALDDLNENWPLRSAEYELDLAQARKDLQTAENRRIWNQKNNRATEDTLEYYEAQLVLAEKAVDQARREYSYHEDESEHDAERAQARVALETAENQRDEISRTLNWYKGEPTDIDQALLDANVAIARSNVDEASQEYEKWRDGPDPDALRLAQATVANAQAMLELARVQARSELRAVEMQLEDSVITAPMAGVVLTRSVEPGEVIGPGVTILTLGEVERLKVTVYVPENRYGRVYVGETARLETDSFPGETFEAEVVRIADEAEYTPRNVQTEEERQTTVYAVELALDNPEGKLKPGMPVDVVFEG